MSDDESVGFEPIIDQAIIDVIPGEGTASARLHLATGNGPALTAIMHAIAANAHALGYTSRAPIQPREELLATALRSIHRPEMFGDCTEDGDPFPCRTIRALDIVIGNGEPTLAGDDILGGSGT